VIVSTSYRHLKTRKKARLTENQQFQKN